MKYFLTLFLFLGFKMAFSQEEKLAEYYRNGEYLRCMKYAEIIIESDHRALYAWLYKSLSLSEMGLADDQGDEGKFASEKSLKTLLVLMRKNKSDSFISSHQNQINRIKSNALKKSDWFIRNSKPENALKIYDLLIQLSLDYEYYYRKGICLINAGSVALGGDQLLISARIIYGIYQVNKKYDTAWIKVFSDLTLLLSKHGFREESFSVAKKAAEIFQDNPAMAECYHALILSVDQKLDHFSKPGEYENLLLECDTALMMFDGQKKLTELKWRVTGHYLDYLVARNEPDKLMDYISGLTNGENPEEIKNIYRKIKDLLVLQVAEEMKPVPGEAPLATHLSRTVARELLEFCHKQDNTMSLAFIASMLVREYRQKGDLNAAGILMMNFPENIHDPQLESARSEFFNQTVFRDDLSRWNFWIYWRKLYGNDPEMVRNVCMLTGKLVDYYTITKQDFHTARTILYSAKKYFPEDKNLPEYEKVLVTRDYRVNYLGTEISFSELNWNGNTAHCNPGTIAPTALNNVQMRLNYLRRTAGVPDNACFKENLNSFAQKAAFVMFANDALSHSPAKTWKCFSDSAYTGSQNSNLSKGSHTVGGLMSQFEDSGTGNYFTGHRRWILYPFNADFGFGSTTNTTALWCIPPVLNVSDSLSSWYREHFVAWPPEGYVPADLVFPRWSFSLYQADLSGASVRIIIDGKEITVNQEITVNGYGLPTLVWTIYNLNELNIRDQRIKVEITGVIDKNKGNTKNYSYIVLPILAR